MWPGERAVTKPENTSPAVVAADPTFDYEMMIQEDKVHQRLYTEPGIFREELTRIFGAVWVYLAHESQVPEKDNFVTSRTLQSVYPPWVYHMPAKLRIGKVFPMSVPWMELFQFR